MAQYGQQGHETASKGPRHSHAERGERQLATGVCRDTMVCIVAGGRPLCLDTACDTDMTRHPGATIRHPVNHDTAPSAPQHGVVRAAWAMCERNVRAT